jgi:hypothetical protein
MDFSEGTPNGTASLSTYSSLQRPLWLNIMTSAKEADHHERRLASEEASASQSIRPLTQRQPTNHSTTLFVGLDVHKDTIALDYVTAVRTIPSSRKTLAGGVQIHDVRKPLAPLFHRPHTIATDLQKHLFRAQARTRARGNRNKSERRLLQLRGARHSYQQHQRSATSARILCLSVEGTSSNAQSGPGSARLSPMQCRQHKLALHDASASMLDQWIRIPLILSVTDRVSFHKRMLVHLQSSLQHQR